MKVECVKEKLRAAIGHAERVTGKNLSLPLLGSILIETRAKTLFIRATNLDIGVELELPAKIIEQGKVAVSGAFMNNFLGLVQEGDVLKMETVNDNLALATRSSSSVLKCLPSDEFPTLPHLQETDSMLLPAAKLVAGLRSVAYGASLSDMKPEISSVYLYEQDGELIFVATDSFRLGEKRYELKDTGERAEPVAVIIPLKNVLELIRIFDSCSDVLFVQYTKSQISFTAAQAGIYVTSRLVGGVFPNYQQIVSAQKKTEVVLAKKELLQALKLATVFTDKFNQVTFKVVPSEGLCEVSSRNGDTGETTTRLDATVEGEELAISFNNKYILDCLSSISEDTLSLAFNGASKPMTIRGMGDASFFYLVMPLNR
ncbi:MAG: DNA polymerase III subunit beta [Parcubacteria group bacterium RIFOXYD2_FULL_52_8]|nr:MAG: DNA polymerase III subunit beta [Parcubacteria group bacterium RIFOXYD2_FULL_52_8]